MQTVLSNMILSGKQSPESRVRLKNTFKKETCETELLKYFEQSLVRNNEFLQPKWHRK